MKIVILIGLALFLSSTSSQCFAEELPFFGKSKIHKFTYKNGLKLLVLEDHSSPTFAYQTWFNVGSRDERKGLTGLAHLFEHMMFKATKNRKEGEFDKILEGAGTEGENAFTSHDYTAYVQALPSKGDNLDLIASLESERMVNLIVDEKALNTEREVVKNERKLRTDNSPDGQIYESIFGLAYTTHHYLWPVIGYEADLNSAKPKDCLDFYKAHYAPNNAVIVIVGDVNPEKAQSIVEKRYGLLERSEKEHLEIPPEPKQTAERIKTLNLKVPVEKILIAYHIPDFSHPDIPALLALQNVLGGGRSSRLYRKLVDGGIASEVSVEGWEAKNPGLFFIGANMQKGKKAGQALAVIDQEIQDLLKKKLDSKELMKSVSQYRLGLFTSQMSNMSRARFIGAYETLAGDFSAGVKMVESLRKVESKHVQAAAKKYLQKSNRSIIFGVPVK